MKSSASERISNYFDLFIVFIEVDIFIYVLFELSFPFRPLVYDIGRVVVGILGFELLFHFLLRPRLGLYLKHFWRRIVITGVLGFGFYYFNRVPYEHELAFILSRLFLAFIEIILFIKFIVQSERLGEIFRSFRVNPAQLIIASFAVIIIFGSFLLYLPYAHVEGSGLRYIDALFTSTSAVCVTGLIVVDTGALFSRIGQSILLLLIQVGGLGIMTIAAFIQVSLGSQMSLYGRFSTANLLDQGDLKNLFTIIRSIVFITFVFEIAGVGLFFLHFRRGFGVMEALFYSIFHSISAFCNAGFSLYADSFMGAVGNVLPNLVLIWLIVSGGLGFTVLLNLGKRIGKGEGERIHVQTRIVLIATFFFVVTGALGFFFLEHDYVLAGLRPHERFLGSLFQSVTTRTAGFNTVDTASLRPVTLFMLSILMFIGASPGSTGGGIKTTTFFILILSIVTILRDQRFNTIFRRRIPFQVVNRAFAIFVLALVVVIFASLLLGYSENFSFMHIYFETVSAFGTVGLSAGITPGLSDFGKIVIMICMFVGRLGPLTMVLAVRNQQGTKLVTYPQERVMVG